LKITIEQLHQIIAIPQLPPAALVARCERWLPHLQAAMDAHGITTPVRCAHFLSQLAHESGRFAFTRELWGPTKAQERYEGRKDLGNVIPGDGYRYRGRGPLQVTGRANYQAVGNGIGLDLVSAPELLEQPSVGALAAAWWWEKNGLNALADTGNVDHVSDRINRGRITGAVGDAIGFAERSMLTERALKALGAL